MKRYFLDAISNEKVKTNDITNSKFNNFTAISFHHMTRTKHSSKAYWTFKCECGKIIIRFIQLVKSGRIKSCGCQKDIRLDSDVIKFNLKDDNMFRTYTSWRSMLNRCNNPNNDSYKSYGKIDIIVCEKWKSFEKFLADMGIRPENTTLDRIDVRKNYEVNNCRWAPINIQANNKRCTYYVNFNDEKLSLKQCVKKYSKNRYDTVWNRLKSNWPLELALKIKPNKSNRFFLNCIDMLDQSELEEYLYK